MSRNYRSPANSKGKKKQFSKTAQKVNRKNNAVPWRGGIRL